MNKTIKDQLSKCKVAIIPPYDDNCVSLFIPKVNKIFPSDMVPTYSYIIEVLPSALNNQILIANWNRGKPFTSKFYKVEKIGQIGDMLRFKGFPFNKENNTVSSTLEWEFFIPESSINVLRED